MEPGDISGIAVALGDITEVYYKPTIGIFLDVDLVHYHEEDGTETGSPLKATVRWCPPYAGADFGDWHLPDVGMMVLCIFPGVTQDGLAGDDLDNGYAHAYVSSSEELPVAEGIAGQIKQTPEANPPLSATRKVYKGKLGVAHDRHYQGDQDTLIDGNETTTIEGDRVEEIKGDLSRYIRGAWGQFTEGIIQLISLKSVFFQSFGEVWFQSTANKIKFTAGLPGIEATTTGPIDMDAAGDIDVDSSAGNHHTGALSIEEIASVEYKVAAPKIIIGDGADDILLLIDDILELIEEHDVEPWVTELPLLRARAQAMRT